MWEPFDGLGPDDVPSGVRVKVSVVGWYRRKVTVVLVMSACEPACLLSACLLCLSSCLLCFERLLSYLFSLKPFWEGIEIEQKIRQVANIASSECHGLEGVSSRSVLVTFFPSETPAGRENQPLGQSKQTLVNAKKMGLFFDTTEGTDGPPYRPNDRPTGLDKSERVTNIAAARVPVLYQVRMFFIYTWYFIRTRVKRKSCKYTTRTSKIHKMFNQE